MTTLTRPRTSRRATAAGATVLATLAVWVVAVPLIGAELFVPAVGSTVGPLAVVVTTLIAALLSWALLAVLERRTARARRTWMITAGVIALLAASRPAGDVTVEHGLGRLLFYDGDLETAGVPGAVDELRAAVAAVAVVIVTPEYNGTVPGLLGNAIDWLSRSAGHSVLRDKPVVVCSASPTRFGGVRAAEHLRTVLTRVGARVTAGPTVATAHERLDATGLVDELGRQLTSALGEVVDDEQAAVPA